MSEQSQISGSIDAEKLKQASEKTQRTTGYFIRQNRKDSVISTYGKILRLISRLSSGRKRKIDRMLDDIGMKFFTAPASSRIDFHSCFPGGLSRHSLLTIKNIVKLIDAFHITDYDKESVIILALFHDLGKIGNGEEDYYFVQEDSYWKRRGYLYRINERLSKIPVNFLSMYLLQKYDIDLNFKEFETIYSLLNKGYTFREEYNLTAMLQWADMWAIMEEKKEIIDVTQDVEEEKVEKVEFVREVDDRAMSLEEGKINFDEVNAIIENEDKDNI